MRLDLNELLKRGLNKNEANTFLNIKKWVGDIIDEDKLREAITDYRKSKHYKMKDANGKNYVDRYMDFFNQHKDLFIEDVKAYDKFDALEDLLKHTDDIDYANQLIKDFASPEEYDEVSKFFNNNKELFGKNKGQWKKKKDKSKKNYRENRKNNKKKAYQNKKEQTNNWNEQYKKFKKQQETMKTNNSQPPPVNPFNSTDYPFENADIPTSTRIFNKEGIDTGAAANEIIRNRDIKDFEEWQEKLSDIIGDASTVEEAKARFNKYGRDNHMDPAELKRKFSQHQSHFFDSNGSRIIKEEIKDTVEEELKETTEELAKKNSSLLGKIVNGKTIGLVMNTWMAAGEYKDSRNAGNGVIKSGVKAAGTFVLGEALGGAYLPVMLAKSAPTIAVNAITGLQTMTRKMNSYQRIQTFGDSYFQDTEQLATMRQAGMELAKMSQYNLQQAIMGNEAQYMHRL